MNPDDPKLTAYALDELDPAERAEIEQLLRENPDALAEVEDTERLAAQLRRELHAEPAAPLTEEQRAELLAAVGQASSLSAGPSRPSGDVGQDAPGDRLEACPTTARPRWWRPLALAAGVAVLAGGAAVVLQWKPSGAPYPGELAQFEHPPRSMTVAPAATPAALALNAPVRTDLAEIEVSKRNEDMLLAARGDHPSGLAPVAPAEPLAVSTVTVQSAATAPSTLSIPAEAAAMSLATGDNRSDAAVTRTRTVPPTEADWDAASRNGIPRAEPKLAGVDEAGAGETMRPLPAKERSLYKNVHPPQSPRVAGVGRPVEGVTVTGESEYSAPAKTPADRLAVANPQPKRAAPLAEIITDPNGEVAGRAMQDQGSPAPVDRFAGGRALAESSKLTANGAGTLNFSVASGGAAQGATDARALALRSVSTVTGVTALNGLGDASPSSATQAPHPEDPSRLTASVATYAESLTISFAELEQARQMLQSPSLSARDRADVLSRKAQLEAEVRRLEVAVANVREQREPSNTESYDAITDNAFMPVRDNPLSTFSIDVDTASYANVRRFLNEQQLPPKGAVRIEELLNYFDYDYPQPEGDAPFSASMEVAACPWTPEHRLVRVGLKGREIHPDKRPASNLVVLVDVSGSMQPENKLPLVKKCLRQLVDRLSGEDTVAMAVYAGASGCVLEPTNKKSEMRAALDRLESGGSTNGAAGIQLAYQLAERSFIKGGVNRVILATDGDFNVGVTNQSDLIDLIEKKAKSGVFLTVLGFGMGNLKDSTLEKLADKGNGNYAYIDTLNEGRKVLVDQMSGTLVTIAKDVKIQVEFNPAQVSSYRLIGYENRMLKKEDFNDDTKDAGEIGAGHTVTALYEVVPAGLKPAIPAVDALKYQTVPAEPAARVDDTKRYLFPGVDPAVVSKELLTLKLRYKAPDGDTSKLLEFPLTDDGKTYERSSKDFRFAAAVASFGMLLRDSPHKGKANWNSTLELAVEGKGEDRNGYRAEFVGLIERAKAASR